MGEGADIDRAGCEAAGENAAGGGSSRMQQQIQQQQNTLTEYSSVMREAVRADTAVTLQLRQQR